MMFTVAICTWKRAASLDATLASFQRLRAPTERWELLIVSNNSSDDTAEVIGRWAADLPIRSVLETRQRLSYARNRAAQEA